MKPSIRASLMTSLLAASITMLGCGAPSAQMTQPAPMAFNETGENVYNLQAENGGKLDVNLQMPGTRSVLAFTEDLAKFEGTLTMGDKKVEFTLDADEYGKAKVSFLNLLPGTWTLTVKAIDRAYKEVGTAYTDVYIAPYEVTYTKLEIKLKDTHLNKDTGALQAEIVAKSGDLKQEYVDYPQWNQGDFPERGTIKKFDAYDFEGKYTAFSTGGKSGKWEGKVDFEVGKYGEYAYLFATIDNGKRRHPLGKLVLSYDKYGNGAGTDFVSVKNLDKVDLEFMHVFKAKETEKIVTGYHPDGVEVQRYMIIDYGYDGYGKEVGMMSSLYFMVDEYGKQGPLVAVAFTDQGGKVGSDPSPGYAPDFDVVHIQALDK